MRQANPPSPVWPKSDRRGGTPEGRLFRFPSYPSIVPLTVIDASLSSERVEGKSRLSLHPVRPPRLLPPWRFAPLPASRSSRRPRALLVLRQPAREFLDEPRLPPHLRHPVRTATPCIVAPRPPNAATAPPDAPRPGRSAAPCTAPAPPG